jgi:histidine triad (HIT) family protein
MSCLFCQIAARTVDSRIVHEDDHTLAFLDHRPLFPGHCLLIPRIHYETLGDLPAAAVEPLFSAARRLALAVEGGMSADGSFVAINNRVSQSVPHLHVHIVPRRRKDGLRGFFWPRGRYESEDAAAAAQQAIANALRAQP